MLDKRAREGEVNMLDEPLKALRELSVQLEKQYRTEHEFYEKVNPEAEKTVEFLEELIANQKFEHIIRYLASVVILSEARTMANFSSSLVTLNIVTRLSLTIERSLTTVANELLQSKQPASTPLVEENIERINEIEKELAKFNKEFSKYRPTLKKFKQALDRTEKALRDNR